MRSKADSLKGVELARDLHGVEHFYIYHQFVQTGITNGPGLLGQGGAIGLIPLDRIDLHNVYNGMEVVLLQLGLWYEVERHSPKDSSMSAIFKSLELEDAS